MKSKLLNLLLILTSFAGYLEWGGDRHLLLYQAEIEIFTKLFTDPMSVMHPFTILPLLGQIALLITLFQKSPNKILTLAGIGGDQCFVDFDAGDRYHKPEYQDHPFYPAIFDHGYWGCPPI